MKKLLLIPLLLSTVFLTGCSNWVDEKVTNQGYAFCGNGQFHKTYRCIKSEWVGRASQCKQYEYNISCYEYTKQTTGYFK